MGLVVGIGVFWLAGPLMFADGPWSERGPGIAVLALLGGAAGFLVRRNERSVWVLVMMALPTALFGAVLAARGEWLPWAVVPALAASQAVGWLFSRPKPSPE